MQTSRFERHLPIAGMLLAVVAVLAIVGGMDTPSTDGDSAAEIFAYWSDHEGTAILAGVTSALGAILVVFFGAALRSALREAEGTQDVYSTLVFGGTLVAAAGLGIDAMLVLGIADAAGDGARSTVHTLAVLYEWDFPVIAAGFGVMFLCTGLGGLRTRRLPKVLSWAAIVLGALFVTPAGMVSFFVLPIWLLATSIVLYRGQSGVSQPRPIAADGVA